MVAALRPAGIDAAQGCLEHLQRLVTTLRRYWPQTHILIRGDSGFCRDAIMSWCEQSPGEDYVLGMAKNERLNRELEPAMEQAQQAYQQSERASRVFAEFAYRTHQSWSAERRVIGKAEYLDKGANPRYVVTSLSARDWAGAPLYEQLYCARGDMENRIKEQQLDMFADRTSAHRMKVNQLRLWLSSMAYVLVEAIRRLGLSGSAQPRLQCGTIRLRLLKIGALIRITTRRIHISLSSGHPWQALFDQVLANLLRPAPG